MLVHVGAGVPPLLLPDPLPPTDPLPLPDPLPEEPDPLLELPLLELPLLEDEPEPLLLDVLPFPDDPDPLPLDPLLDDPDPLPDAPLLPEDDPKPLLLEAPTPPDVLPEEPLGLPDEEDVSSALIPGFGLAPVPPCAPPRGSSSVAPHALAVRPMTAAAAQRSSKRMKDLVVRADARFC
jgi:hypothetical protein